MPWNGLMGFMTNFSRKQRAPPLSVSRMNKRANARHYLQKMLLKDLLRSWPGNCSKYWRTSLQMGPQKNSNSNWN